MATNIRSDCNGLGGVGYHSSISVAMFTTHRRQVWHEFEQLIGTAIGTRMFPLASERVFRNIALATLTVSSLYVLIA